MYVSSQYKRRSRFPDIQSFSKTMATGSGLQNKQREPVKLPEIDHKLGNSCNNLLKVTSFNHIVHAYSPNNFLGK